MFLDELLNRLGGDVEHDALVAAAQQALRHMGAHPSQSDHSELHEPLLCQEPLFIRACASAATQAAGLHHSESPTTLAARPARLLSLRRSASRVNSPCGSRRSWTAGS